jgi:hypothetical protein
VIGTVSAKLWITRIAGSVPPAVPARISHWFYSAQRSG